VVIFVLNKQADVIVLQLYMHYQPVLGLCTRRKLPNIMVVKGPVYDLFINIVVYITIENDFGVKQKVITT